MATQVSDTSTKSRLRGSPDDLAVVAQRAQAFTNASGTAIALSEGNRDEIVCRARAGSNAPEVGTAMRVDGSFTGLCIQSGKELRCDDAETDTRVDTAAIRALGIRSMVVIPIKDEGRIVGVLAVFAPTAHAFTITHVAVLKTMADQISAILQRERKGRDEGFSPEPLQATPVPAAKPAPSAPAAAMPPAVVIKPAAQSPATRPLPVVPKVEPVRTTVVAADIAPSSARKKKEAHADEPESKSDYRINLGTLDAAAAQGKKPDNRNLIVGIAAIAVVAVIGAASYVMLRKPGNVAQTQPESAPAAVANPPAVNPASPVSGASTTASVPAPAPAPAAPATNSSDNGRRPDRSPARVVAAAAPPKHEETQSRREEPEPKREETVALSAGPSRISGSRDSAAASETAPSIALGSTSSGNLSTLANPVSVSTPSILTQSELDPVKVTRRVAPLYPPVAKQRRLSGSVVIEGVVGVDGKITGLKLASGPPIFRDAAFDAVKQWQFTPARLNGKPIEQPTKIRLDFNPPQ